MSFKAPGNFLLDTTLYNDQYFWCLDLSSGRAVMKTVDEAQYWSSLNGEFGK